MTLNTADTSRLICDALTRDADRRRALATRLATKADSHDDAAAVVDLLKEAAILDAVTMNYRDVEAAADNEPERSAPTAAPSKPELAEPEPELAVTVDPGNTDAAAHAGAAPAAPDIDDDTIDLVVDEHGTPTDPIALTERRRSIDPADALAQRAKETAP